MICTDCSAPLPNAPRLLPYGHTGQIWGPCRRCRSDELRRRIPDITTLPPLAPGTSEVFCPCSIVRPFTIARETASLPLTALLLANRVFLKRYVNSYDFSDGTPAVGVAEWWAGVCDGCGRLFRTPKRPLLYNGFSIAALR